MESREVNGEELSGEALIRQVMCRDDACRNLVPSDLRLCIAEIDRLRSELHEAHAWTLGPAIMAHGKDAILSAARHLRSLYDTNKSECNLHVAARLVEEFAFKVDRDGQG